MCWLTDWLRETEFCCPPAHGGVISSDATQPHWQNGSGRTSINWPTLNRFIQLAELAQIKYKFLFQLLLLQLVYFWENMPDKVLIKVSIKYWYGFIFIVCSPWIWRGPLIRLHISQNEGGTHHVIAATVLLNADIALWTLKAEIRRSQCHCQGSPVYFWCKYKELCLYVFAPIQTMGLWGQLKMSGKKNTTSVFTGYGELGWLNLTSRKTRSPTEIPAAMANRAGTHSLGVHTKTNTGAHWWHAGTYFTFHWACVDASVCRECACLTSLVCALM